MVHALGFSSNPFNTHSPGRLCRGRERWIEPWEPEEAPPRGRGRGMVISGAAFSDISAADALRGLPHAGIDPASLISQLFPRKPLLAFM